MPQPLKAKIARPAAKAARQEGIRVKVTITNTGKEDLSILPWNTPLDALVTDCLHVSVDGRTIPYDGPMVKRAAPTPKDYITIRAGESITTEFVVSDAYDTTRPGKYAVKLKTPIPDVVPRTRKRSAKMLKEGTQRNPAPIAGATTFQLAEGAHRTLGARARQHEVLRGEVHTILRKEMVPRTKGKLAGRRKAGPAGPMTVGGNARQKAAAEKAHKDGYALCVKALAGLANTPGFTEWFGPHTAKRLNKVKQNYGRVKTRMETLAFTYDLSKSGCTSGVYAYTYKGTQTIWFCDAFWSAPPKGTDSKAGTVLHEHTHSDADTDDVQYGQTACRQLAISSPSKAVLNADTHEYYAGG